MRGVNMLRIGPAEADAKFKKANSIYYKGGQYVPNWQSKSDQNQARIGGVSMLRIIQSRFFLFVSCFLLFTVLFL